MTKAFSLILALVLSGCATIINGSKQNVSFLSDPPGATITIGDIVTQTPTALQLKRNKDYTIIIKKEGYKPQTTVVHSSFDHWVAATLGNIWNYIIPGLLVDVFSGSAYELDRTLVNFTLERDTAAPGSATAEPVIATPASDEPQHEVARPEWSGIPSNTPVTLMTYKGDSWSGTLVAYDGSYFWLALISGSKKTVSAADVAKVTAQLAKAK